MRHNDARKWLHAGLDLLPIILIPVFMIYSHRHTIDSGSIEVPVNRVVDFNQQSKIINSDNYVKWAPDILGNDVTFNDNEIYFYGNALAVPKFSNDHDSYSFINTHKYLVSFDYENNMDATTNVLVYIPPSTTSSIPSNNGRFQNIYTCNNTSYQDINFQVSNYVSGTMYIRNVEVFDLTQMFGAGDEPTIDQFNLWYSNDYYSYTLSSKQLLKGYSEVTYDDTDIMSQFTYQLYNSVDKYFNMGNVFNMGNIYDWFNLNIFGGNAPISIYIVWNIVLYEFIMDLLFLLYGLFMWFIDMCKKLMEKPLNSIK